MPSLIFLTLSVVEARRMPMQYDADMTQPLAGKRIVVPESRELDLFARMLEAEGAVALRCPMVTIRDADDPKPIKAWLAQLIADEFSDLILLTGEGLRRIIAVAQRAGNDSAAIVALGKLRTVSRGPKPVRALRELGLAPGLIAAAPTTEGVIETLSRENLAGRHVGVQLYPDNPNQKLIEFLRGAGAEPAPILPYRYASDAETEAVVAVIADLAAGRVDAIAFTSSPQIKRLTEVAKARGLDAQLKSGLARTKICSVGPVVSAAIEALGCRVAVAPETAFHLKPLVKAIATAFAAVG
jgi:uroporphyrinogen-III synthase